MSYDGKPVLANASMQVYQHDFIGVVGPNGGGKTSLIKAILNLVKPSSGEVEYHISKNNVGYLPQVNQLDKQFPISVLDVVRSGRPEKAFSFFTKAHISGISRGEELLDEVGALHLRDKAFGDLSGGQMQRVLLCRALMGDPKLLILDEPDTYVDSQFEAALYDKLKELNERMAIILVSHDLGMISSYVKTIACVNKNLHYHPSNILTTEQLDAYNCPLQIISHGDIPHVVLGKHEHNHNH